MPCAKQGFTSKRTFIIELFLWRLTTAGDNFRATHWAAVVLCFPSDNALVMKNMTAWFENFGLGSGVKGLTTDNAHISNVVKLDHLTMSYCW